MRRVLVIRDELLPLSETFVKQQALQLKDWQATLVGQRLSPKGLPLDGLRHRLLDLTPTGTADRWRWRLYRRLGWPLPAALRALMAPEEGGTRPELAHVHFGTDAVAAWQWLAPLRLPVVVTLHGYDIQTHPQWWEDGLGGEAMRDYPTRLRAMATDSQVSFIAVSEAVRRRAIDVYRLPEDKITTLHIGVDTDAFQVAATPAGERPQHVLFVGRLVEKKGLDVLIDAMAEVHARFPQARVKVVGDGPLRAQHEARAHELAVPVDFLGAQPSAVVRDLMGQAYAFCLPSVVARSGDAEGFGLVLLEAQACGVPVLTSAVGGRDEGLVHGETGFAFDEGDRATLASQLCELLGDPTRTSRMGRAARAFVEERFPLASCNSRLEHFYTMRAEGGAV
ncbi:glycosyltransferase [Roseateles aquatilis]|uniref:glycosyltransferase n=1 Tax=Roseateles aquatilis TaxID=431061 RepID=UPI00130314A1|nr:glycosyltransferase [Roseateles aquatilis]